MKRTKPVAGFLSLVVAAIFLSGCTVKAKRSDYNWEPNSMPGGGLFTGKKGEYDIIKR